MKMHVFGLGLLLLLAVLGCLTNGVVQKPVAPLDERAKHDPKNAEPLWRLIGIKVNPAAPCPKIPGLQGSQLFERDANQKSDPARDRFCLYEGAAFKTRPPLAGLGLSQLAPDAVALSPAVPVPGTSTKPGGRVSPRLAEFFTERSGRGRFSTDVGQSWSPVRLAFLDSEPTVEGMGPQKNSFEHGHFLRLLGARLAGSSVHVTTELALPITKFDAKDPAQTERNWMLGGKVGSFVDLAQAIERAVTTWVSRGRDRERHLVLNLSVGWDGGRFGGLHEQRVADLPAGPQAVYLALENAAREGALIFAAAGNARSGSKTSQGPLLPAAWASRTFRTSSGQEEPLLYAVGGVQADGSPIANARPRGVPELAAYADHVALINEKGEPTSTYTGTSVATAVVSSIAAKLWSEPNSADLSAAGLVKLLKERGQDHGYSADFGLGTPRPNVKEIAYCSTFLGLENCPEERRPEITAFLPRERTTIAPTTHKSPRDCPSETFLALPPSSAPLAGFCPTLAFESHLDDPWVFPQPESDPCVHCAMGPPPRTTAPDGNPWLHVEVASEWCGHETALKSATLEIEETKATGEKATTYLLIGSEFSCKKPIDHSIASAAFPRIAEGGSISARIHWVIDQEKGPTSILSPVLIAR